MAMTTMGVKLDEATRDRIKKAAHTVDRTPHWLIKQAIFNYLEQLEGETFPRSYQPTVRTTNQTASSSLNLLHNRVISHFWNLLRIFYPSRSAGGHYRGLSHAGN
ncbi:Bifunctional protein putA [Budvicia aquatica]|uniref:Bifunctional protein putA n=1 Tax=Budvicia aquatica TaxID=82979 RepID=A0A484ZPU9_9GAMM|nr:Bifunctional protein putA [Budvicia aquatica]